MASTENVATVPTKPHKNKIHTRLLSFAVFVCGSDWVSRSKRANSYRDRMHLERTQIEKSNLYQTQKTSAMNHIFQAKYAISSVGVIGRRPMFITVVFVRFVRQSISVQWTWNIVSTDTFSITTMNDNSIIQCSSHWWDEKRNNCQIYPNQCSNNLNNIF